jgi:cysteinyl-tRNA synthetase
VVEVDALVDAREAAREAGDWGEADSLRARLEVLVTVDDTAKGLRVRRSP